jgi:hypothetical protein
MAGEDLAAARQEVSTLLPLAVHAAGGMRPDEDRHDYLARVRQLAVDLWLESTAESETVRRIAELSACRTFPAVLLGVRVEASTTRAVLTLRSWGPDGERQEEIRTDRTDDPRGVRTLELARGLIGHRVTVYKLEEPGRSAYQRYRCAKHLVDLGPADPAPVDPAPPGPADPAFAGAAGSGPAGRPPTGYEPAGAGRPGPAGTDAARARGTGPIVARPAPTHPAPTQPATTPAAVAPVGPVPSGGGPVDAGSAGPGAGVVPAARRTRRPVPYVVPAAPAASARVPEPPATAPGVPMEQARLELLALIEGDEDYREAALHGILRRAATDDTGGVLNIALLRMLAERTPGPGTAAGRKILAGYRDPAG